jgi:L1 cell adhesion molecule like protein
VHSGVPQIEVTFEVDANGIINVAGVVKDVGRVSKITITNDRGRLSKDDIDRMVADAERHRVEDEAVRQRQESRSALDSYGTQRERGIMS